MQKTYEAKVNLDSAGEALLTAFARQYGSLKRKLYAWVASKGGKVKDHKVEFCYDTDITARQFNALAVELQGLIDGVRELLKERVRTLERAIRLNKGRLYRAEALEKDSVKKAKRFKGKLKKEEDFNKSLKELPLKIEQLKKECEEVRQRLKANVPVPRRRFAPELCPVGGLPLPWQGTLPTGTLPRGLLWDAKAVSCPMAFRRKRIWVV